MPIEDFENYDCKSISGWDWSDDDDSWYDDDSWEVLELEMQNYPNRFWFDDETGDWGRIEL
jgi:hypothetical protein